MTRQDKLLFQLVEVQGNKVFPFDAEIKSSVFHCFIFAGSRAWLTGAGLHFGAGFPLRFLSYAAGGVAQIVGAGLN